MMIIILTIGVLFNRISWVDIVRLSDIELWIALLVLFLFVQFILLRFIDRSSTEVRSVNPVIRSSRFVIWVSQILISSFLIALLVEILLTSKYHTVLLTAICSIAYSISILFTGILTYMFISWFKNQRNVTITVYGIASAIIVFNLVIVLLFSITILSSRPDEVRQFLVSSGIFVQQESFEAILDSLYQASSIAMFVAIWFATAVLLHNYSRKLGKVRYWILVALPLVYFLSQFISNILNISIILTPDPVLRGIVLTSIFTISLVAGGIMFGTAFTRLSSKFYKDNAMRNYLVIAGYGFMFLLISNNGVLIATVPYPPYGILSVSFIGVASYSILLGIYSSAVAASNDLALRKSIRKFGLGEGKLLDSISVAEAQKIMEDRASQLWLENQKFMTNEVGFATLTKEEVKIQVEEIMKELVEIRSRRNKRP